MKICDIILITDVLGVSLFFAIQKRPYAEDSLQDMLKLCPFLWCIVNIQVRQKLIYQHFTVGQIAAVPHSSNFHLIFSITTKNDHLQDLPKQWKKKNQF